MRIYEATLLEKPHFGERMPAMIDGREVAREIVAETAGKARYSFLTDLRDAWGDVVEFSDIRVRSLSRNEPRPKHPGADERLETANAIIRVIGSHGRHFLSENSDRRDLVPDPFFARFQFDARNELWFVDRYSRKPVLVRGSDWVGFSDGGTLRSLINHLANYIHGGYKIQMRLFGPWPEWICGGDLWAYGDDMQKVREGIGALLTAEECE